MIGILLFYWIWKGFSNLAVLYDRNKWKYFFIGLGSYLISGFIAAIIFLIIATLIYGTEIIDNAESIGEQYDLLFTIVAGLCCYGTYKFLENRLEKEKEVMKKEGIDNIGVVDEN